MIRELPISVVNKIAAGEVVERPASIVKELFENSIDAGATKVSIVVDEGGVKGIAITDNGSGILREDLSNAFLRHATSKIFSYEDLFQTVSMGFRGEALAAIASVAQIDMTTRPEGLAQGSRYGSVPGIAPSISDWDGPRGTTIRIANLFQNVPVRRKFLKTPSTELSHIQATVIQIALGHPEVAVSLSTSDRMLLSLPSRQSPINRLVDLSPEFDLEDFAEVSIDGGPSNVRGYILTPAKIRKDRQNQHFFLNRRWVRHPAFYQAVSSGGQGMIQKDVHLGVWIFLEMDPKSVDVNVHPTKREVRFQEPDRIFSLVRRAVSEGISRFSNRRGDAPSLNKTDDFQDVKEAIGSVENPEHRVLQDQSLSAALVSEQDSPRFLGTYSGDPSAKTAERPTNQPTPVLSAGIHPQRGSEGGIPSYLKPGAGDFSSLSEKLRSLPRPGVIPPAAFDFRKDSSPAIRFVAQSYETFLLAYIDRLLVLVDQHTAGERIRYDTLRTMFAGGNVLAQPFLFPSVVRLPMTDVANIESRMDEFLAIGFKIEPIGPESLRVDAVPAILSGEDPQHLMEELSASSHGFEWPLLRSDRLDETLMTLSCHTSIRAHDILEPPDAERLILTLLKTEYPFTCPHGRPTILSLEKGIMESWFDRT